MKLQKDGNIATDLKLILFPRFLLEIENNQFPFKGIHSADISIEYKIAHILVHLYVFDSPFFSNVNSECCETAKKNPSNY